MQFVTLVNRSSRELVGTWDGRRIVVAPKSKNSLPRLVAEAVRKQNPIMGSDDEMTGNLQYLCGIEEDGDELSPIEQSDEIELFNRRLAKTAQHVVVVPGNVGMYTVKRGDVAPAGGLPLDASFVNPSV